LWDVTQSGMVNFCRDFEDPNKINGVELSVSRGMKFFAQRHGRYLKI